MEYLNNLLKRVKNEYFWLLLRVRFFICILKNFSFDVNAKRITQIRVALSFSPFLTPVLSITLRCYVTMELKTVE